MTYGEVCGRARKGYKTHMFVVGSAKANPLNDNIVSITGDTGNNGVGDGHIDRISLLKDIYKTTRMIEVDPRPERVQHGTGRRVSHSHCLTTFGFSRGQDQTDWLDEWIKEVQSFFTTSAVQPKKDIISYVELGARPKVPSDQQTPAMSVEDRDR